jgi:PAS domain S-box-containing protein
MDLLREALLEASDGVLLFDADLRVVVANRAADDLLGYAAGELLGRFAGDLVHRSSLEALPLEIEELRRGDSFRSARLLVRKDGTTIEVEATARLLSNGCTVAILRDDRERRRASAWFQAILERAYDGVVVAAEDGTLRYVSPNAERILGFPPTGTSGFDLVHPDDLAKVVDVYQRSLADHGVPHRTSARIRHPFGVRTLEVTVVNLVRDPIVAGLIANFRDVTDRVATEHKFESIVSVLSEGIVIQDPAGAIVYANEGAARIFDTSRGELTGKTARSGPQIVREDGTLLPLDAYPARITARTGEPQSNVVIGAGTHDGDRRWLSVNTAPLRHADGSLAGVVASFFDITSHKAIEQALRKSEARLMRALEGAGDGFWDIDIVGPDDYFSDRALEIFGFAREEWSTAVYRSAIHPEDRDRVLALQQAHIADDRGPYEAEYRFTRKDGAVIWIRDRGRVAERDAAGRATRVAGSVADVTEQRRLEEQLRQAQKMESIGRLAGGIAHDFNNLLTVILGYARMLEERLGPEDRADLEQVIQAGEKAADLTKQILAFSRKQVLAPVDLDLNTLVGKVLAMIGRMIGETIDVDFIPGRDLGNIFADPTQIEQVLMNLCINARDAMPGGGRITIETENVLIDGNFIKTHPWAKRGRYVLLSVSDTGHGIPSEDLGQIFEPFYTTKAAGRGTGLGLSTVYGIVKQHDGSITVDSEVGRGTTFEIYLPIRVRQASSDPDTLLRKIREVPE